jgi:hypothetical protein
MLRISVVGITEACIQDPDGMLRDLLKSTIDACTVRMRPATDLGRRENRDHRAETVRQWDARQEARQRESVR